ncbi:MAG: hypothetical protein Q9170_006482 [Blastenia crenularia]
MIDVLPKSKLIQIAEELDAERANTNLRGLFYGAPIIVKDIFNTDLDLEMAATLGSYVLRDAKHSKEALLIQRVASYKGENAVGGLSAIGSQCQSPYIRGGVIRGDSALGHFNPGGSSTGFAAGVAAGYSPLAIGGEADGSINTPANKAALFALKCTPQKIPSDGIFLITPTFESPGGMAKTVQDLAGLIEILISTTDTPLQLPKQLPTTWSNFTLGSVDPNIWQLPLILLTPDEEYSRQMISSYEAAIEKIKSLGGHVQYPIPLVHPSKLKYKGKSGYLTILLGEIRDSVNRTLEAFTSAPVRSLADIIEFNKDHAELQAGLDQTCHIQAQEDSTSQQVLEEARREMKKKPGKGGIDSVLSELRLDAIMAPMDSPISTVAALAVSKLTSFARVTDRDGASKLPLSKRTALQPLPRCKSSRRGKVARDHACL